MEASPVQPPSLPAIQSTSQPIEPGGLRESRWSRWVMQTARKWEDIKGLIRPTGIENIDSDHRRLTEIALGLNDILDHFSDRGLGVSDIELERQTLDNLYSVAADHFMREEWIIDLYKLPNKEKQIRQHRIFLDTLKANIDEFKEGMLTTSFSLRSWILEWWINHINNVDYDTFCRSNWTGAVIGRAACWDDVSEIVRRVRIDQIDDEHKRMTEMALEVIMDGAADDLPKLRDGLIRLYNYADSHFQHEEQVLKHYGLPGLDRQQVQHEVFRNVLRSYADRVAAGERPDIEAMRSFVLSWWINHINDVDSVSFAPVALAGTVFLSADCWEEFAPFIRSTGHKDLDSDHREITGLIIQLKHMTEHGASREQAVHLFDNMLGFAHDHFEREEQMIKARSALLGKLHMDDHARFITMLKSYREDIRFGRTQLSNNMRRSLLLWWSTHINEFDYHTFQGDDH